MRGRLPTRRPFVLIVDYHLHHVSGVLEGTAITAAVAPVILNSSRRVSSAMMILLCRCAALCDRRGSSRLHGTVRRLIPDAKPQPPRASSSLLGEAHQPGRSGFPSAAAAWTRRWRRVAHNGTMLTGRRVPSQNRTGPDAGAAPVTGVRPGGQLGAVSNRLVPPAPPRRHTPVRFPARARRR